MKVQYFDAVTAFLNGQCKSNETVPVRLPAELRRYRWLGELLVCGGVDRGGRRQWFGLGRWLVAGAVELSHGRPTE